MLFIDLANAVIPGYSLLNEAARIQFEQSAAGQQFIIDTQHKYAAIKYPLLYWNNPPKTSDAIRTSLILTDEYEQVIIQIVRTILSQKYPDFNLLSTAQQIELVCHDSMRTLYPTIVTLVSPHASLSTDESTNDDAINERVNECLQHDDMAAIRETIAREKPAVQLQARINAIDKLYNRYESSLEKETLAILLEESNQLAEFLASCLNLGFEDVLNIHTFNANQALSMALDILERFDDNQPYIAPTEYFDAYQTSIIKHLNNNLGTTPQPKSAVTAPHFIPDTTGMLSALYASCVSNENVHSFFSSLDKLADAHAFIQATGFSTQNENSYMSWIDVYNYGRAKEYIAEVKNSFYRFLTPFIPLMYEYRDITQRENNVLSQVIRTLMPMLVVASVVIAVSALLTPLMMTETAFLVVLIPTLYIALVLAAGYVTTKNYAYHALNQLYFGGQYEIPQYQVNARMEAGFGNREKAQQVRDFYIKAIKECYEIEANYQAMAPGSLSDEQIENRKSNITRRDTLQLEWFDIHSNINVGCNRILHIVLKRVENDDKQAQALLQSELSHESSPNELVTWAQQIVSEIKTTVEERRTPAIHSTERQRFFIPACITQQAKIEYLHHTQESLAKIC